VESRTNKPADLGHERILAVIKSSLKTAKGIYGVHGPGPAERLYLAASAHQAVEGQCRDGPEASLLWRGALLGHEPDELLRRFLDLLAAEQQRE
jgi:hypothetical protein